MAQQTASPSGYALNPFAAQTAGAQALRSYAPNPFAGSSQGVPGQMAEHLSRGPNLDEYLTQAYRELHTDPQAKQYEQTTPDIDKLWRYSPNAPIFKEGYAHNPYVMERAARLREAAQPKPVQTWGMNAEGEYITPTRYVYNAAGEEMVNPEYNRWLQSRQENDRGD